MTEHPTGSSDPPERSLGGVRRRGRRPALRLLRAGTAAGALILVMSAALLARSITLGALVLLIALGGLAGALAIPRFADYLERNLPAGGLFLITSILGLVVAGLLEAARLEVGRPVLAVVAGVAALLAGAIAAGLRARKFQTGIAMRGFAQIPGSAAVGEPGVVGRIGHHSALIAAGLLIVIDLLVLFDDVAASAETAVSLASGSFALAAVGLGALELMALLGAVRGSERLHELTIGSVATLAPEVLVHFSGGIRSLYQLEHWLPAIEATGLPWMLVCRERPTFLAAADRFGAPTVLIEDFGDLDLVVTDTVGAVVYVNTATKNNHVIRYDRPVHIQLHHGDSDKPPSAGKTMRLYDTHFVAGAVARRRLQAVGIDPGRIVEVGRPVTDGIAVSGGGGDTVLYAPTWEGAHADSDLSSLARQGEQIVKLLAASGRNVVFRPHPLSGTADSAAGAAALRVGALVIEQGGVVDDGSRPLVAAFDGVGLLIADVSSVIVDWYAVDRPVLVTDVAGLGEAEVWRRYPTTEGARVIGALDELEDLVAEAFAGDPLQARRRAIATAALGEIGSAKERFAAALVDAIRLR